MNTRLPVILLAEDDPDDQELITYAFSKVSGNYHLQIVNDGKEAVQFLEDASKGKLPCLIVLDYNMPELNGAQVLQRLAGDKRFDNIPKVILSTSSNPVYISESLDKGACAYKVKPHSFQQMITVAKEIVDLCDQAA